MAAIALRARGLHLAASCPLESAVLGQAVAMVLVAPWAEHGCGGEGGRVLVAAIGFGQPMEQDSIFLVPELLAREVLVLELVVKEVLALELLLAKEVLVLELLAKEVLVLELVAKEVLVLAAAEQFVVAGTMRRTPPVAVVREQ